MAESVFRKGAKDVHHAFRGGGIEFEHDSCRLDGRGNAWGSVIPPGPRCPKCFAAYDELRARDKGKGARRRGPFYAVAGGAALVALWLYSSQGGGPVTPTVSFGAFVPSASPTLTAAPSASAALASQTPAPTVGPDYTAVPPVVPVPTPLVIERRIVVIVEPQPVATVAPPPLPTCVHPGTHIGVDPCRWPHN